MPLNFLNNGYFAGTVGIGTNSPNEKLEVNGAVAIGNATDGIKLRLTGTVGEILGLSTTSGSWNDLDIRSQAAPQLYLKTDGNVGIGTASPDYLLDLYKFTDTTSTTTGTTLQRLWNYVGGDIQQQKTFIDFVFQDANDNEYPQVRIGAEVGQNGNADTQEKEGSGAFVVYTNNATGVGPGTPTGLAERFRVDYKGDVGIGTNNPFSSLQVGNNTFSGGNGMAADSRVGISNHGTLTGMMLASTYDDPTYPEYGLVFVQGASTASYNVWSISPDGPTKGSGLSFIYKADATNIHNQTPQVYFEGSTGHVGIGTTDPTSFNSRGRNLVVNSNGDTGITISANTTSSSTLLFADSYAGTGGTTAYRGSIEYDHSIDSMALSAATIQKVNISGTTNTAYTPDGLWGATATPSWFATTGGGKLRLGYQDNGSGLYASAYGFETSSTDGLGNTSEIRSIVLKNTNSSAYVFEVSNLGSGKFAKGVQIGDDADAGTTAGKAGTMRYRTGTEYVEDTGKELITDGNFASSTYWGGTNVAVASGVATFTGTSGQESTLFQQNLTIVTTGGTLHSLTYTVVSNNLQGSAAFYAGFKTSNECIQYGFLPMTVGTHTVYGNSVGTGNGFSLHTSVGFTSGTLVIDNVSVYAVTAEDASYADMCMQTGSSTYEWVNIVRNTY